MDYPLYNKVPLPGGSVLQSVMGRSICNLTMESRRWYVFHLQYLFVSSTSNHQEYAELTKRDEVRERSERKLVLRRDELWSLNFISPMKNHILIERRLLLNLSETIEYTLSDISTYTFWTL